MASKLAEEQENHSGVEVLLLMVQYYFEYI